jgi:hypothetical protein
MELIQNLANCILLIISNQYRFLSYLIPFLIFGIYLVFWNLNFCICNDWQFIKKIIFEIFHKHLKYFKAFRFLVPLFQIFKFIACV